MAEGLPEGHKVGKWGKLHVLRSPHSVMAEGIPCADKARCWCKAGGSSSDKEGVSPWSFLQSLLASCRGFASLGGTPIPGAGRDRLGGSACVGFFCFFCFLCLLHDLKLFESLYDDGVSHGVGPVGGW